jgi:hypothetical protein
MLVHFLFAVKKKASRDQKILAHLVAQSRHAVRVDDIFPAAIPRPSLHLGNHSLKACFAKAEESAPRLFRREPFQ